MARGKALLRVAVLLLLGAGFLTAFFYREALQPALLEAWVLRLGGWGPLLYVLTYALAPGFGLPALPLTVLGGALFGPLWGAALTLVGASIADSWAFLLARYVARDWVEERSKGILGRVKAGIEAEGWRFIAFARLTPIFPFSLVSYAFGLTRIPFVTYAVTTFFCIIPGAVAYAYLGYAGKQALGGQEGFVQNIFIAVGLLLGVGFVAYFLKNRKKSLTGEQETV